MAAKIKKGDTVVLLAGKDKGKTGEVLRIVTGTSRNTDRAVVKGLNLMRRHQRQTQNQDGGIFSREASVHISNLALRDPKDNKPTRVGFEFKDGAKVRVARRSGEVIDG
ncbi:MAG: 50S ribosomal protein L24 [Alphaproteobacteria bacterium]|nr:50S ribosomal protein L24 [Alphaproteobacteria bacterium]